MHGTDEQGQGRRESKRERERERRERDRERGRERKTGEETQGRREDGEERNHTCAYTCVRTYVCNKITMPCVYIYIYMLYMYTRAVRHAFLGADHHSRCRCVWAYAVIPGVLLLQFCSYRPSFLLQFYGYIVILAASLYISDALLQTSFEQFYGYTATPSSLLQFCSYIVILAACSFIHMHCCRRASAN